MKTTIEGKLSCSNKIYVEIEQINEYNDTNYVYLDESLIQDLLYKLTDLASLKHEMLSTNPNNTENSHME